MTKTTFSLLPFSDPNIPEIKINGAIDRRNNVLLVDYHLTGNMQEILFPPLSAHTERKDDLWKATCFEFFLAVPNDPQYWEFNMSPSGNWNIYQMSAYRRVGFREEVSIKHLSFSFRCEPDDVIVDATVDLDPIISSKSEIQVGITCVIQLKDGHESYWALAHPKPQADFHLRESFALTLAT